MVNTIDYLSKRRWIAIHGTRPHSPTFEGIGWKWTPKPCQCKYAHYIDCSDKNRK